MLGWFALNVNAHEITVRAGPSRFCPVRTVLYRVHIGEDGQTTLGEASGRPDPNLCAKAAAVHWLLRATAAAAVVIVWVAADQALRRWFPRLDAEPAAAAASAVTTAAWVAAMAWLLPKMVYYRYVVPLGDERMLNGIA